MKTALLDPLTPFRRPRSCRKIRPALVGVMIAVVGLSPCAGADAAQIWAGVAKADITDRETKPVNDPLYVKALVLRDDATTAAIVTVDAYIRNIHVMEQLTRIRVNMDLLEVHQAQNAAAGKKTIDVEVAGVRVGDFVLVTFPGELSVEIGLNIKKRAPTRFTFVAGCTNGYIYYAPTGKQRNNAGFAQEDCDCLVAPEWQQVFEDGVDAVLKELAPVGPAPKSPSGNPE